MQERTWYSYNFQRAKGSKQAVWGRWCQVPTQKEEKGEGGEGVQGQRQRLSKEYVNHSLDKAVQEAWEVKVWGGRSAYSPTNHFAVKLKENYFNFGGVKLSSDVRYPQEPFINSGASHWHHSLKLNTLTVNCPNISETKKLIVWSFPVFENLMSLAKLTAWASCHTPNS